jgi:hypothetical protein
VRVRAEAGKGDGQRDGRTKGSVRVGANDMGFLICYSIRHDDDITR